jgi:RHS repeat-associated protein
MLDSLSLVHMNGRVYDPGLGRVLSADPIIQAPYMTQSHNRYSYVMNNPLALTDPSGFSWWTRFRDKWVKPIVAAVAAYYTMGWASGLYMNSAGVLAATECAVASSSITMAAGAIGGAAGGFTGSMIMSGGDFTAGLRGAIGGGLTGGISGFYGSEYTAGRVLANSAAGGVQSRLQGGSFADGARIAFKFSALAYLNTQMRNEMIAQSKIDDRNNGYGMSGGMNGDGFKLGGGRWDLSKLTQDPSLLGGLQSGPGEIFGFKYESGSFVDMVVESFVGPHDKANSYWFYNADGLIKAGTDSFALELATNYTTSLLFAGPFAAGAIYEQTGMSGYRN